MERPFETVRAVVTDHRSPVANAGPNGEQPSGSPAKEAPLQTGPGDSVCGGVTKKREGVGKTVKVSPFPLVFVRVFVGLAGTAA